MQIRLIFIVALAINCSSILLSGFQNGFFNPLNLLLALSLTILILLNKRIAYIFRDLIVAAGVSNKNERAEVTLLNYITKVKSSLSEVNQAIASINEIGNEKYTEVLNSIKDDDIRITLQEANTKIMTLRSKERQNSWVTEGVAAIAELKQKGNNINEYADQAISAIVKYINANQGGFFLTKYEHENTWFELIASYAYKKKKYVEKAIPVGQGLIGQLYYEKEIVYMTDVPEDYVKITSGLGEALPRCICIIPLMSEGKMYGAIEIASFTPFHSHEMEYLKKIADSIGYNLGMLENNRKTEILLEESQKMSQEVKAQEEELRQNMEELTATQEQMKRKERELDAVLSSLSTVELDLEGHVLEANPVFLSITGYSLKEIQGQLYKNLIPQHGNDPVQYGIMWSSILSGRSFSGEFRIVNRTGKEMWMAGNFTPIIGDYGKPYKVMVISLFTTQDKEKLFELQEMVTAMKNCFPIAEINSDLTFKTANDLFLTELGIKRLDLKKTLPQNILENGSFGKLEQFILNHKGSSNDVELNISSKSGGTKKFNTSLIKIGGSNGQQKKGLMILRNVL